MGAFTIEPKDLITPEKKDEPIKKSDGATTYLKNYVDTAKIVKTAINESLSMFGLTTADVKEAVVKQFKPVQQRKGVEFQQPYRDTTLVEKPTQQIQKQEEKKVENIDIDKYLKKAKLIVKFLKAEDLKVSEFFEEIEKHKEDLKELLE